MSEKYAYTTEFCIDAKRLEAEQEGVTAQSVKDWAQRLNADLVGDDYVEIEQPDPDTLKLTVDLQYTARPNEHNEQVSRFVTGMTPYATAAVRIFSESESAGETTEIAGPVDEQVRAALRTAMEDAKGMVTSDEAQAVMDVVIASLSDKLDIPGSDRGVTLN